MGKRISRKEEMAIIEAINEGKSCTSIARDFKRSTNTISMIANRNGLDFTRARTKKATEAQTNGTRPEDSNIMAVLRQAH